MNLRSVLLPGAPAVLLAVTGCATQTVPCVTGYAMRSYPQAASANSAAQAPANQQQFSSGVGVVLLQQGSGLCPIPQIGVGVHPVWTNPDPAHLTISSADDSTNGLATCLAPTAGPVTLTATLPAGTNIGGTTGTPLTAAVQLTCR